MIDTGFRRGQPLLYRIEPLSGQYVGRFWDVTEDGKTFQIQTVPAYKSQPTIIVIDASLVETVSGLTPSPQSKEETKLPDNIRTAFTHCKSLPSTYIADHPRVIYFPMSNGKWEKFPYQDFLPFIEEDHRNKTEVFFKLKEGK
jgi:hypothetical protein